MKALHVCKTPIWAAAAVELAPFGYPSGEANVSTNMSDNKTPCLPEFLKLMDCMNDKPITECYDMYHDLIKCLKVRGLS